MFGGGNVRSLYRPMSETEQEVLDRLIENQDLKVVIVDWGYVDRPTVKHGDARIQITWDMTFGAPAEPRDVYYFDLELQTQSGALIYKERQPTIIAGEPLRVQAGVTIGMIWDIQIAEMSPEFVKTVMPKVTGLTTRRGNERFTPEQARTAHMLSLNEKMLKTVDPAKVRAVMKKVRDRAHKP